MPGACARLHCLWGGLQFVSLKRWVFPERKVMHLAPFLGHVEYPLRSHPVPLLPRPF